eukprot:snap_masked-scaffold_4-processed-gene-6.15-mRNA-1 protein AED:0.09 eAED:0.09 QI:0/0/0/0.5/1/1/2/0/334
MKKKIRIGGVPEHFNTPLEQCLSKFKNFDISFQKYPGGTGAMCEALDKEDIDIALVLTEGAVFHALKKNTIKLLGFYVKSPLLWGVHVNSKSQLNSLEDLKTEDYSFAISRFGSGSHLMSFILFQELGIEKEPKFEVIQNLSGAREAMKTDKKLVFLWEKFMTAPFVESGEFKCIGVQPTPWPCFSVAIRKNFLSSLLVDERQMLLEEFNLLKKQCEDFKNNAQTVEILKQDFGIREDLAKEWISLVEYDSDLTQDGFSTVKMVAESLVSVGKLEEKDKNKLEEVVNILRLYMDWHVHSRDENQLDHMGSDHYTETKKSFPQIGIQQQGLGSYR